MRWIKTLTNRLQDS